MLRGERVGRIKRTGGNQRGEDPWENDASGIEDGKKVAEKWLEGEKGLREERVFRQTGAVGSLLYICLSLSSPSRKIDVPRPGTKFQGRFQTKDRFRGNSRELIANNARALSGWCSFSYFVAFRYEIAI